MSCKPIDVKFSEGKETFDTEFATGGENIEAQFKDVGVKGASAYEIAVMRGFQGTVDEWLESLHGEDGKPGTPGKDGYTPVKGKDYWTETDKQEIVEEVLEKVPSGGGGASVQADWNAAEDEAGHVKNRTHWLERPFEPITWDGTTEGRDSVDVSLALGYPPGSVVLYKISDKPLSSEALANANYYVTANGENSKNSGEQSVDFNELVPGAVFQINFDIMRNVEHGLEDFAAGTIVCTFVSGDFSDTLGVVIPSVGIYCMQTYGEPYELEINGDVYHKLPDDFLSDNVATVDYVNNLISDAIGYAIGGSY